MSTREILYRGKRIDNGEWAEGLPSYNADGYITEIEVLKRFKDNYFIDVHPETVCQYTGLTDKNERKIFEGDIINVTDCGIRCGTGDASFEDGAWYVSGELQERLYWLDDYIDYEFEVIGNIFDNPELLGDGGEESEK